MAREQWLGPRPGLQAIFEVFPTPGEAISNAIKRFAFLRTEIARHLGCHPITVSRRLRRWEAATVSPS